MSDQGRMPSATRRWLKSCEDSSLSAQIRVFPAGTKTAEQAARAVGCQTSEILKSLVFEVDGEAVLALVPGDRKLDVKRLAQAAGGHQVGRASLDRVKEATGFAAGGTPPFGHPQPIRVFADRALRRHDRVWAAAGAPTTVFPISLVDLNLLANPGWYDLS